MKTHKILSAILLVAGVLVANVCAAESVTDQVTLAEKQFQRAAKSYRIYQHEGKVVYCKKDRVVTSSIPVTQCLTEAELRLQVENYQRTRNPIERPVHATTGSIG